MTDKKYVVADDRTVTTAERVFVAGDEIVLADQHLQPLLLCGAVIEVEVEREQQPQPKPKKKGAE